MSEVWRAVPGFTNYEASDLGRIRRIGGGVIKPFVRDSGYCSVTLMRDASKCQVYIHRIILLTFVGPAPDPSYEAAHRDGKRGDNRLKNLRWSTSKDNAADRVVHGTQLWGSRIPWSKLTEEVVREIRSRYSAGERQVSLAAEFGIRQGKVSDIVRFKSWKRV